MSGFLGVPSPATVNLDLGAVLLLPSVASAPHAEVETPLVRAVGVPGMEGSCRAVSAERTLRDIFLLAGRCSAVSVITDAAALHHMTEQR